MGEFEVDYGGCGGLGCALEFGNEEGGGGLEGS